MKKALWMLSIIGFTYTQIGSGATTGTQSLTMTIASASNITVSGNPGTLAVTLNTAGTGSATDSSTTYSVTSNTNASGTLQITGAITTGGAMPTNTTLTASLASNSGTSLGAQTLTTTAVSLVNKLPTLVNDTAAITYTFNVTNGWTIAAQTLTRTVTLTLTSNS